MKEWAAEVNIYIQVLWRRSTYRIQLVVIPFEEVYSIGISNDVSVSMTVRKLSAPAGNLPGFVLRETISKFALAKADSDLDKADSALDKADSTLAKADFATTKSDFATTKSDFAFSSWSSLLCNSSIIFWFLSTSVS